MEQNLISAVLLAEDISAINGALETIKQKLPFLITLSPEEKLSLHKLGNTLKPMVDMAADAVERYPQILSGMFNKEEFIKDYTLYEELTSLEEKLAALHSAVESTQMAVGSDTLLEALEVYGSVRDNKNKVPGLDSLASSMQVFFKRKKGEKPQPPQA